MVRIGSCSILRYSSIGNRKEAAAVDVQNLHVTGAASRFHWPPLWFLTILGVSEHRGP